MIIWTSSQQRMEDEYTAFKMYFLGHNQLSPLFTMEDIYICKLKPCFFSYLILFSLNFIKTFLRKDL